MNCSELTLTPVAVPTGIQPIFPGMFNARTSLKRMLAPCNTKEGACSVGNDGCATEKKTIGRCNSTHGVLYEHRLPEDGEAAIVSFFNPSALFLKDGLAAIARASLRLYFEVEPPVHARVPQEHVLRHVDGTMTYTRDALVRYPYFSPAQLWDVALRPPNATPGFHERLPAIAVFVSNCHGHRKDVIDWLRRRFNVHSYGKCRKSNKTVLATAAAPSPPLARPSSPDGKQLESGHPSTLPRKQHVEGGHLPECLRYRIVFAMENSACTDYVSEKLYLAALCGSVPLVRTVKGVPNYASNFGPLPVLDASSLDDAFASRVHKVLTHRAEWEAHLPAYTRSLQPSAGELGRLAVPNPHCALLEAAARYRAAPSRPLDARAKPVRCTTFYHMSTPRTTYVIPRRKEATNVSSHLAQSSHSRQKHDTRHSNATRRSN